MTIAFKLLLSLLACAALAFAFLWFFWREAPEPATPVDEYDYSPSQ